MLIQRELSVNEILEQMEDLKFEIYALSDKLRLNRIPVKAITYKDVISHTNYHYDSMLLWAIKSDELREEIKAKLDSYYDLKQIVLDKIRDMRREKSVEEMIVFYRDKLHFQWDKIASLTYYSARQCQRIYKNLHNGDFK